MIYRLLISVGLICCFVFSASAQNRNAGIDTRKNVHINEKKPTVYLEFVKLGKRNVLKPTGSVSHNVPPKQEFPQTEEIETTWLRVYNNSRWAIQFQVDDNSLSTANTELRQLSDKRIVITPTKDSELELAYGVELVNSENSVKPDLGRAVPYSRFGGTALWLASGESVVFLVKRAELKRNLQIFLPFKYEWETSEKNEGFGEPEHRVYFTWDKLEKAVGL
jgi:hypothetical protein